MKINTYRNHSRLRLVRYTLTPVPRFNGSDSINRGSIEVDTLQRLLYTHRMLRFLRVFNNSSDRNLLNLLYVVTKYCTKVVILILALKAK